MFAVHWPDLYPPPLEKWKLLVEVGQGGRWGADEAQREFCLGNLGTGTAENFVHSLFKH